MAKKRLNFDEMQSWLTDRDVEPSAVAMIRAFGAAAVLDARHAYGMAPVYSELSVVTANHAVDFYERRAEYWDKSEENAEAIRLANERQGIANDRVIEIQEYRERHGAIVQELEDMHSLLAYEGRNALIGAVVAATSATLLLTGGGQNFFDPETKDNSFMPGDSGPAGDTAFHIALGLIPGIPEMKVGTRVVSREVVAPVEVTSDVTKASIDTSSALNPLSPDFDLTGQEYEQDLTAATELLSSLPEGAQIVETSVYGRASDEASTNLDTEAGLGVSDSENYDLANLRLEIANTALSDAATELGIKLPESDHSFVAAFEHVLEGSQVAILDQESSRLGLSRMELIRGLEAGINFDISDEAKQIIDEQITGARGASYFVDYQTTETVMSTEFVTETVTQERKGFRVIANEFWVAAVAFVGFLYGGSVFSSSFGSEARYYKRIAKKIARQQGLKIPKYKSRV